MRTAQLYVYTRFFWKLELLSCVPCVSFQQVADITHSLQRPAERSIGDGAVASGGLREMIPCIARTCVAVGVDGVFMEVHDDPLSSPVDSPTQWPLRNFRSLLEEMVSIAKVSKVISQCPFLLKLSLLGLILTRLRFCHRERLPSTLIFVLLVKIYLGTSSATPRFVAECGLLWG